MQAEILFGMLVGIEVLRCLHSLKIHLPSKGFGYQSREQKS
jgi:hypothetical protein